MRALEPTGLLKLAEAQIHQKQWHAAAETLRKLDTQTPDGVPSTPERRCLIAGSWGGRGHTTTDHARTQGRFGPTQLFLLLLRTLPLPDRLLVVIDDSPTKRYGPKVEGADIHRYPTPGPADQEYLCWTPAVDLVRRSQSRRFSSSASSRTIGFGSFPRDVT